MGKRTSYFNFDKNVVDALDEAVETCKVGDVPDLILGIISTLQMNGWEIKKDDGLTIKDSKNVWAVETNTDLTEGRGRQYILCFCEIYATAKRKAHKAGVQGTDARVHKVELIRYNNSWYGPVEIECPSGDDIINQEKYNIKQLAEMKAKELGLSDEDIAALRS
jgi:hypothetical protein